MRRPMALKCLYFRHFRSDPTIRVRGMTFADFVGVRTSISPFRCVTHPRVLTFVCHRPRCGRPDGARHREHRDCARGCTRSKTACSGRRGPKGVTAVEVAPGSAAATAGIQRGDVLLAVNGARSRRAPTSSSTSTRPAKARGSPTRCCGSAIQQCPRRVAGAVAPPGVDVLRAGGRRPLHAAGRRVGPAAPAARSGDAAFLLAVRRVLRRVHVLVQRSVRSPRLGLLLGRRGGDGAAAAAAAALHAGVSRSAPPWRASRPMRWLLPLDVPAGARAGRRRAIVVVARAAVGRRAVLAGARRCSIAPSRCTCSCAPSRRSSCWRARSARSRR